uniref:Galectin n=1 Tax=Panagrellus redivivus TaxID=6233 RepID=A0A7E4VKJ0_PANRE
MLKTIVILTVIFGVGSAARISSSLALPFEAETEFAVGDELSIVGLVDENNIHIKFYRSEKDYIQLNISYYDENRIDVRFDNYAETYPEEQPEFTINSFPRFGHVELILSFTEYGIELAYGVRKGERKFVQILNHPVDDYAKIHSIYIKGFKSLSEVNKQ